MKKIVSLIRVNLYNLDYIESQKNAIKKYLKNNNLDLDDEMEVEINIPKEESNIFKVLENCDQNYTLIVADLNVFGRTIDSILEILKLLVGKKVRVIAINQNLDLFDDDMLTQMILVVIKTTINLEKELMSLRTREALNAKKIEGVNLGKPKGTIQKSKFDEQRDKIEELLKVGVSVRKISKLLGYNNHIGLNNYVKKRGIRAKSEESLLDIEY